MKQLFLIACLQLILQNIQNANQVNKIVVHNKSILGEFNATVRYTSNASENFSQLLNQTLIASNTAPFVKRFAALYASCVQHIGRFLCQQVSFCCKLKLLETIPFQYRRFKFTSANTTESESTQEDAERQAVEALASVASDLAETLASDVLCKVNLMNNKNIDSIISTFC